MTDQELRIKCLEIAVQRDTYDSVKAAQHYYNFIINKTSDSELLKAASEFIAKAQDIDNLSN